MITCLLALSILAADPVNHEITLDLVQLETDGDGGISCSFITSLKNGKLQIFEANEDTKVFIDGKPGSLTGLFEVVCKAKNATIKAQITTKDEKSSRVLSISIKTKS